MNLSRCKQRLKALLAVCSRPGRILILMQNNPDPDAIASAAAVQEIARILLKKRAIIGHGGIFGRAENRAMVQQLHIKTRQIGLRDLERFRIICLVDTQPYSGNNVLFPGRRADIVIDHHERTNRLPWNAEVSDIRPHYGATSTILYEYLQAANIRISQRLATALYYGIQSDTSELGRKASKADIEAFQELTSMADLRRLPRIRRAPVPPAYFGMLHEALTNAVLAGHTVITFLAQCNNPDMVAEIAEMMLRLQGVDTSVGYGVCKNTLHISARAPHERGNLAKQMKRVTAGIGTGGGHRSMAGGQVPITDDKADLVLANVRERILRYLAGNKPAHPLLIPEPLPEKHETS